MWRRVKVPGQWNMAPGMVILRVAPPALLLSVLLRGPASFASKRMTLPFLALGVWFIRGQQGLPDV